MCVGPELPEDTRRHQLSFPAALATNQRLLTTKNVAPGATGFASALLGASGTVPLMEANKDQCHQFLPVPRRLPDCPSPIGLKMAHRKTVRHFHKPGHLHELTFSCYRRMPLIGNGRRPNNTSMFHHGLPLIHGLPEGAIS